MRCPSTMLGKLVSILRIFPYCFFFKCFRNLQHRFDSGDRPRVVPRKIRVVGDLVWRTAQCATSVSRGGCGRGLPPSAGGGGDLTPQENFSLFTRPWGVYNQTIFWNFVLYFGSTEWTVMVRCSGGPLFRLS